MAEIFPWTMNDPQLRLDDLTEIHIIDRRGDVVAVLTPKGSDRRFWKGEALESVEHRPIGFYGYFVGQSYPLCIDSWISLNQFEIITKGDLLSLAFDWTPKENLLSSEEIQAEIESIKKIGNGDNEAAHQLQDKLYEKVLEAIAQGRCSDPVRCAATVLRVRDIEFDRWYS